MMSGMKKIKELLEDSSFKFKESLHRKLPTKGGLLDTTEVEIYRGLCIVEALTENVNSLVTVDQEYPSNDESLVHFKTDLVVLRGEDYRNIIKLLDGNTESR